MMGVTSLPGSSWKEKLSIRPEEGCSEMVLMYVRPSARVREVLSRVVPAEAKADGTSSAAVSTRAAARLDRSCRLGYFMLTLLIRLEMDMYRRAPDGAGGKSENGIDLIIAGTIFDFNADSPPKNGRSGNFNKNLRNRWKV